MKAQFVLVTALLATTMTGAFAENFPDYARVVSSTAIVQRVNAPRQECWTETQQVQTQSSGNGIAGSIIGGVAGGLLGHQIGGGRGNTAATVAGAIGGAMLGDHVATSGGNEVQQQEVRRCKNVDQWQDQVTGYQVTYEYKGHNFVANMPQQPGDRIPVSVNVQPR